MAAAPGVGQLDDLRSLVAAITKVAKGEEGGWAALLFAVVAIVPLIGDAAKSGWKLPGKGRSQGRR